MLLKKAEEFLFFLGKHAHASLEGWEIGWTNGRRKEKGTKQDRDRETERDREGERREKEGEEEKKIGMAEEGEGESRTLLR